LIQSTAFSPIITSPCETLFGDHGFHENHRVAAVAGVELVAPTSKGGEKKPLSEFQFDAAGNVTASPAGHAPTCCKPKKNAKHGAVFELECNQNCPRLSEFPVKLWKNGTYLNYTEKQARLAQRRAREQAETFLDTCRWRSGVEASMSELDRLPGIKKLRVRGCGAVFSAYRVFKERVQSGLGNFGLILRRVWKIYPYKLSWYVSLKKAHPLLD
jgi:hypothetical protein